MEIYKDIEGYEGLYKISNQGRVLSLGNGNSNNSKERILKPLKHKNGYLKVILSKQGKIKNYLIHRLVCEAFLPNPNNLSEINHRDEDKTNNFIQNLEWCTREYNSNYGTRTERTRLLNTNHPNTSKKVMCVETGLIYPSTNEVQRQTGFSKSSISMCCNGKQKTCSGFHWKYVQ